MPRSRACHASSAMMSDANREQGAPMQVCDVAELVADALVAPVAA